MKSLSLIYSLVFLLITVISFSCKQEEEVSPVDYTCKRLPPFVQRLGFNPKRSAFSTAEKRQMGLVLKEFADHNTPRTYQDPSWKKAGWLAAMQVDNAGNIFLAPGAFINILNNPPDSQNILYKVKGTDGLMVPYINLPKPAGYQTVHNPFGIMGVAFNCKNNLLYVSSIAGSDAVNERGMLFVIDAATGSIIQTLNGYDLFGLEVVVQDGKPYLFAGRTRYPTIESFSISSNGKIKDNPSTVISIDSLSFDGNNKIRKIVANQDGSLLINAISFDYNMVPASEKKETVYHAVYNSELKKWKAMP